MSPRIFFGWLLITTVTVVLALFVVLGRPTSTFDPLDRDPVFPALRQDPDAAAKLEVNSRFGAFTLVRADGKWSTPDRYNYPVDEADVRRLVAAMADMHFIERKTSRPDRFARLEVDDITGPESESAYVKISNAAGAVLAETIVGRPSARFISGSSSGTYIRQPNTDKVWLVSSVANVQTRLIPWLDRTIVSVPANTVARIQLNAGGAALTLSRASADEENFTTDAAIPEGRALNDRKVTTISRALAKIELEDVKPRADVTLPDDAPTATVTTFDGVAVTLRLAKIDDKPWATFAATYTGDAADQSDAAQAARATVADINQRVGKWAYWLHSAAFESLTSKLDDVLEEKKKGSS